MVNTNLGGYDKTMSQFVAGIAVIMMYFYHFFAFPKLWPYENCFYTIFKTSSGVPVEQIISIFGQLCVAIFAFNTGFVIYKRSDLFRSYKKIVPRLFRFLIGYWGVCILFLIYGKITNVPLPDINVFLTNLVGLNVSVRESYINVTHAWYVSYYIFLLLSAPVIYRFLKKDKKIFDCLVLCMVLILLPFLPETILKVIWPISASLVGFFICKNCVFERLFKYIERYNVFIITLLSLSFLLVAFIFKVYLSLYLGEINAWGRLDGFYALLVILPINMLYSYIPNIIKAIISKIGSLGMFYWFIHSIFVVGNREFLGILYMPYIPLLITIWGLILITLPALICNRISSILYNKLKIIMNDVYSYHKL